MIVEINSGNILKRTIRAEQSGKKIIIHKGGTGSGKTFDIMQFLIITAIREKNKIITVVSESKPHLDIGAIRILKSLLKEKGIWKDADFNISTSRWTAPSGTIIEFFSADRIDKALGARRDVLYGNEINSLKQEVWDELARRSELVIADFNPTSQFWLETWMANYDDTTVITSNYTDNPFLPDTERGRIEKRASRDPNFRRIHIDCEYGIYEGLVFTDWQICERTPDGTVRYGLDFGYTNDPTALIKVVTTPEATYLDELIYQTGMLNRDIINMFAQLKIRRNYDEIIADSAEPKTIDELRLAGYNVKPALKGADSVNLGIDRLKSKPLFVTKRSVNLIKELRNYAWVSDKDGNPTNKPVDMWNHAIDASRYATEPGDRKTVKRLDGVFF
jgi:phage terminase large subunit